MPSVLYKQLHFCLGSQKLGEGEAARSTLVSAQVGLDWNHRVIVRGSCCGFLPTPPPYPGPGQPGRDRSALNDPKPTDGRRAHNLSRYLAPSFTKQYARQ